MLNNLAWKILIIKLILKLPDYLIHKFKNQSICMTQTISPNQRLKGIDALRGLAVIIVCLYHYCYRYQNSLDKNTFISTFLYFGQFGVQLFFIISGFVIFWTACKYDSWSRFILARACRLYPAYWFGVLFTSSILTVFILEGKSISLRQVIINLTMMQEFLFVQPVDGVYWSLTVEILFYAFMACIIFFKLLNKIELLMFVWLILGIYFIQILEPPYALKVIKGILLLRHIQLFIAGICFFKLWRGQKTLFTLPLLSLSYIYNFYVFSFSESLFILGLYALFYFVGVKNITYFHVRVLLYLGKISYSFYLIHQYFGYIVLQELSFYEFNFIISVFIAICLSLAVASLMFRYIEKPSYDYLHQRFFKSKLYE